MDAVETDAGGRLQHGVAVALRDRRLLAARLTIALSLVAVVVVGLWNAFRYPMSLGYDYKANAEYMHVLVTDHRLPTSEESAEFRQPPLYYIAAELAARAGKAVFHWHDAPWHELPEHSYRGAQLLNVAFVLATALLLLSLAKVVAPRRPTVQAAALAFFAFLPVVAKTAAMVHPEPMNMFLSTASVWVAVRIARREAMSARWLTLLVVLLVLGIGTRASNLFTAAAVVAGLLVRFAPRLRAMARARYLLAVLAVFLVGGGVAYWVVAGGHGGNVTTKVIGSNRYRGPYFDLPTKALFSTPFRTNYVNAAFPETYTEIWGDWMGSFAWSDYAGSPPPATQTLLQNQSMIGVVPTLLAICGYVYLLVLALRRRRDVLALALVVPLALGGYFLRSFVQTTPDGDLFKASYVLTTAPVWALGFGLAFDRLGRFRLVQLWIGVALVIFAVLELRFMLYGIRDGHPIF